ncbi:MAG: hypothetical protein AAB605_02285 [Patescibacteria group bacterium]
MCDFSLESARFRNARKGDRLVLTHFSTGTNGFTEQNGAVDEAVCLKPGTRLAVQEPDKEPREALFVQPRRPSMMHRDSVKFVGDQEPVLLQKLPIGTTAEVTAMPFETESAAVDEEDGDEQVVMAEADVI